MKIALCFFMMALAAPVLHGQDTPQAVAVDTFSTPHFFFVYDSVISKENLKSIADEIELICGEFNEKASLWLSKQVVVAVVPSFQGLEKRFQRKVASPVFYSHDTLVVVSWHDAGYQLARVAPLIRYAVAYSVLEKSSAYGAPRWLMRGYALRFSKIDMKLAPPPIASIRSFDDFGEEELSAYDPSQSGDYNFMLVKTIGFLIDRFTEQKFVRLFSVMRTDRTLAEGFEMVFGEKYTATEKGWRAYIDTQIGGPKPKKQAQPLPQEK